MNNYRIKVKEISEVEYIVAANSQKEADDIFSRWADSHQEWIYDDLADNSFGWEYSLAEIVDYPCEPDIKEEMIEE